MSSTAVRRPPGVTAVVVLTVISGLLDIAVGIGLVLVREDKAVQTDSGLDSGGLLVAGIIAALIGLFVVLVARALSWGSNVARFLVLALMAIRLAGGIAGLIRFEGAQRWSFVAQALLALLVLVLLLTPSANAFFRAKKWS